LAAVSLEGLHLGTEGDSLMRFLARVSEGILGWLSGVSVKVWSL
jgi:hypothetical protein